MFDPHKPQAFPFANVAKELEGVVDFLRERVLWLKDMVGECKGKLRNSATQKPTSSALKGRHMSHVLENVEEKKRKEKKGGGGRGVENGGKRKTKSLTRVTPGNRIKGD